jgi:hypothetical protein
MDYSGQMLTLLVFGWAFNAKSRAMFLGLAIAALLFAPSVRAALWSVNVNQQNGLPVVTRCGAPALASAFVFWRKDWASAGLPTASYENGRYVIDLKPNIGSYWLVLKQ